MLQTQCTILRSEAPSSSLLESVVLKRCDFVARPGISSTEMGADVCVNPNAKGTDSPFWARWENPGLTQKIWGGLKGLAGLDRGGRSFPVFPDDRFLVSYPRSGNTWTRFLVANLLSPDEEVTFANIDFKIPDPSAITRRTFAKLPRPRLVKSHEYFDPRYGRVIYIVRDPRDVVISNYFFQLKKGFINENTSMDEYVQLFVGRGIDSYASWGENVTGWLAIRGGSSDLLLLRYEDMLEQTAFELGRIAAFLKVKASPCQIERAIALSLPERMRKLEKTESSLWQVTKNTRKDIPFVRSAKSGSWREMLSNSQLAQIERAWGPLMRCLQYELVTSENAK